jgi:hypothetical protein
MLSKIQFQPPVQYVGWLVIMLWAVDGANKHANDRAVLL